MTRRLGIIGAGGHGKVAAETALRCGWEEVIFLMALLPVALMTSATGLWLVNLLLPLMFIVMAILWLLAMRCIVEPGVSGC